MNLIRVLLVAFCVVLLCGCGVMRKGRLNLEPSVQTPQKIAWTLQKEGYRTVIGRLPLEEQLAEAWNYQREKDADGSVRYFVTTAKSIGSNFNIARMQAESLAKVQLAGLIETRIAQLITNKMEMSGSGDRESILKTVSSSKNIVTTRLSRLVSLVEIYKDLPDGRVEVQLLLACNTRWAVEVAGEVMVNSDKK